MAKSRVKKTECPNCGHKLSQSFNYCPSCGQENHTHKIPIRHFFVEFLHGMFHFDARIFASIRDLFIPGRYTVNYNLNKRARYISPLQFYFFVSVLFFLILSLASSCEKKTEGDAEQDDQGSQITTLDVQWSDEDTTDLYLLERIKASPHPDELIDDYLKVKYPNLNWFNKNIYRNVVKVNSGHLEKEEILHSLYKAISYSMFFLMPIFALYLLLIYWRKKFYYSEHLIFAINFHTLIFIMLGVWQIFSMTGLDIGLFVVAIILLYLLFSMHRVYPQNWFKTTLKFLLVVVTYSISLCIVLLIAIVLSIFVI